MSFIAAFPGGNQARRVFMGSQIATNLSLETHRQFSVSLGESAVDRYVVICGGWHKVIDAALVTLQFNGVSVPWTTQADSTAVRSFMGIAPAPGGTSAVVEPFLSDLTDRWFLAIYSLYAIRSVTPHDSGTDAVTPFQTALDIPQGGVGFGVITGEPTTSWSNLAEDCDITNGPYGFSTASSEFELAQSALNVQATRAGANAFIAASWEA